MTYLRIVPPASPLEQIDGDEHEQREHEQHDRDRGGAGGVVALDRLKMYTEATSVSNGMFPEMRTIEPNSPTALPNESAAPERIAGIRFGSTMRRNVWKLEAPSERAASSISWSSSSSTGWTARTTNGSVTKSSATTTAARV